MFYAYVNHPHRRATVHLGSCRECRDGVGRRMVGTTRNGYWTVAFTDLADLTDFVTSYGVRTCQVCQPRVKDDDD